MQRSLASVINCQNISIEMFHQGSQWFDLSEVTSVMNKSESLIAVHRCLYIYNLHFKHAYGRHEWSLKHSPLVFDLFLSFFYFFCLLCLFISWWRWGGWIFIIFLFLWLSSLCGHFHDIIHLIILCLTFFLFVSTSILFGILILNDVYDCIIRRELIFINRCGYYFRMVICHI